MTDEERDKQPDISGGAISDGLAVAMKAAFVRAMDRDEYGIFTRKNPLILPVAVADDLIAEHGKLPVWVRKVSAADLLSPRPDCLTCRDTHQFKTYDKWLGPVNKPCPDCAQTAAQAGNE